MKLFCITGMPGAGKSIIASVAESIGLKVIAMGDVIREEARRRGISESPESLGELMLALRREEGPEAIAKRCIEKLSDEVAIIEGIRSLEELDFFKSKAEVCLIAVHASPLTRFKRLLKRGRPDDPKNLEEFIIRDMREIRIGIGSVIALADIMFINEGTIEELVEKVRDFFRREFIEGKSNCSSQTQSY
ncbi:MAG: AAA family ATPase [Candidatus Methanomethyliaceae archaeon]|nr:AAA family ATPase [Candidatus Methanomethyliaceae archaeon]MDW7971197.1 AAA family ATPase [Nitrososphaerota archaeon]